MERKFKPQVRIEDDLYSAVEQLADFEEESIANVVNSILLYHFLNTQHGYALISIDEDEYRTMMKRLKRKFPMACVDWSLDGSIGLKNVPNKADRGTFERIAGHEERRDERNEAVRRIEAGEPAFTE